MSHLTRSSTRSAARIGRPVSLPRHHRRPVRHPLSRQRPRVPAGREVRELRHRLCVRARRRRHHRPRLRLRGALSANPPLCAALNRHFAQLPASGQPNPAEFWHENAINGKEHGFPYDDDASQSSDISVANPRYMIVAVGW
jgi:Beta-1,3-glucanase